LSTPAASTEKAGVVEDFVDIFFSPSTVYERRRDSSAWVPLIVVSIALGVSWYATRNALQPMLDAEFARGMQEALDANRGMTAEQLQQGRKFAEAFGSFAIAAGTPIAIFFTGWALSWTSKLVEAQLKLGTAVMIAAWAFVPRIIGAIVTAGQLQFMKPESLDGMYRISSGPARFLDPDTASPLLVAVAGRFDVFIVWTTLLLAIGVSVVARIPRAQAAVAALCVWVLAALPTVYSSIGR
jgi:hypothetical protein